MGIGFSSFQERRKTRVELKRYIYINFKSHHSKTCSACSMLHGIGSLLDSKRVLKKRNEKQIKADSLLIQRSLSCSISASLFAV